MIRFLNDDSRIDLRCSGSLIPDYELVEVFGNKDFNKEISMLEIL